MVGDGAGEAGSLASSFEVEFESGDGGSPRLLETFLISRDK